jgi:molecular chaperone DnaK (HSP70)
MSPDETESQPSRYVVGIDLGTTNSALCYVDTQVDTQKTPWTVATFSIPQVSAIGQVESREVLPSFHYQPTPEELLAGASDLPWTAKVGAKQEYSVGVFAREHGALTPGRMVSSAKSWLCHGGVDRNAELLPWRAAEGVAKLSPVVVSSRYIAHLRSAWNHRFPNEPLERQDVVLTLPASFDEVARELTIAAAAKAGLPRVVLIEEPQAAFYSWLDRHAKDWESRVTPGQKILVCDIGGGTSDFTLIRVRKSDAPSADAAKVQFHRVAVGEHLILGGDNLDLALAHYLEEKLSPGKKLDARSWDLLLRASRNVKEALLDDNAPESMTVRLPSTGSKLIGGGMQTTVTQEEVQQILLEGFFPRCELVDKPNARRSGFQEFGLPYAPDSAATKYLAAFLTAHRFAGDEGSIGMHAVDGATAPRDVSHDPARPDLVLFNGGVFSSGQIQERIIDCLRRWFRPTSESKTWSPKILENDRLDLAVARGAAYYGMVRRGDGVRIAASLARSYYVGVDLQPPTAVCIAPGSTEPGETIELANRKFRLTVGQPVEFPLYCSSTRLTDAAGDVIEVDPEQLRELAPIRTVIQVRRREETKSLDVTLQTHLSEIGTLEIGCAEIEGERKWRLQFDVRAATQTDAASKMTSAESIGLADDSLAAACGEVIFNVFAGGTHPDQLMKQLAEAAGLSRGDWPPSLLRRMWEVLIENEAGRSKSKEHEARWLNLAGYVLRPGYGMAMDDWRVSETWKKVQGKLLFASPTSRNESLVLWRRIAGGLTAGQQRTLASPIVASIRSQFRKIAQPHTGGKGDVGLSPQDFAESWRLLGSLELLSLAEKTELGNIAADMISRKKLAASKPILAWAIGRLGTRQPLYGPLNAVVAPETAVKWLDRLLEVEERDGAIALGVMQLARLTGDRYRDLEEVQRQRAVDFLSAEDRYRHFAQLVREGGKLDEEEQGIVFGETLPKGLQLAS